MLHNENLPVPHPLTHLIVEYESEDEAATEVLYEKKGDPVFEESTYSCEPHLLLQDKLTNLIHNLNLSKE